ncbi:hypothetical protein CTI12_AA461290 [Artemisia annua]|uniref:Uncharacterized protein n=1 Tax=Artemisia annua TaxID=35608 RepID=A0A2U1LRX0_ARTAN|nr:hypothetical protein CTI12_AA461290 [Artemisia annua]
MEGQSSHASVNPNISANTSSDAGTGLKCTSGDMAWEWGLWKDPTRKGLIWSCQVLAPLVDVVRLVDTEEKPCMGYIYDAMSRAKEQITKNLTGGSNDRLLSRVLSMIQKRWTDQLYHPLHAAFCYVLAFVLFMLVIQLMFINVLFLLLFCSAECFLNPAVFHRENANLDTNREIKTSLYAAIDKLVPHPDENDTSLDPILLRDVEENDEWTIPTENELQDFVDAGDGLLWSDVREAMGGNENIGPSTRSKRERYRDDDDEISIQEEDLGVGDVEENDEWTIPTENELQDFVDAGDGLLWSDVREAMGGNENIGPSTRSKRERYRDDDDEISIQEEDLGVGGNLDKEVNALEDVDSDAEPVDCN